MVNKRPVKDPERTNVSNWKEGCFGRVARVGSQAGVGPKQSSAWWLQVSW